MRLLLHCCWYSFLPSNASTAVDYPDATRPSITTVSIVLNGFNFGWTSHFDTEFRKITILSVLQMWVERAGEAERDSVAVASQHCEVTDCGCARARVCRLCANSSPCAFEHSVVRGFDCECSLCQRALSQNECLLEIKLALFILVIPAGGRKAERDPGLYTLFKKNERKKKKNRLFSFPLQSSWEPPSSVFFRVQMRWTRPATQWTGLRKRNSFSLS